MRGKVIVCRCEDVTLKDVEECLARGYRHIEEVKRYTGFGTGPCQGKECLRLIALAIAERTGQPPSEIPPFTSRPPASPTPFKLFARAPEAWDFDTDAPVGDADPGRSRGDES